MILKTTLGGRHPKWIGRIPKGTLADLRAFLADARTEFLEYDEDAPIADHLADLGPAAEYLAEWG